MTRLDPSLSANGISRISMCPCGPFALLTVFRALQLCPQMAGAGQAEYILTASRLEKKKFRYLREKLFTSSVNSPSVAILRLTTMASAKKRTGGKRLKKFPQNLESIMAVSSWVADAISACTTILGRLNFCIAVIFRKQIPLNILAAFHNNFFCWIS